MNQSVDIFEKFRSFRIQNDYRSFGTYWSFVFGGSDNLGDLKEDEIEGTNELGGGSTETNQ